MFGVFIMVLIPIMIQDKNEKAMAKEIKDRPLPDLRLTLVNKDFYVMHHDLGHKVSPKLIGGRFKELNSSTVSQLNMTITLN